MIPSKYVYELEKRINSGETNLTIGKVIAEHHPGVKDDNPHLWLTNGKITRYMLIEQTAYALACQIK